MSHTQEEPWTTTADGLNIKSVEIDQMISGTSRECLQEERIANARRIVACVNACAGISTEELEVAGRLAAAEEATLRRMARQRDELLRLLGVHPSDDAMKFAAEASEHLHIAAVQRNELLAALKALKFAFEITVKDSQDSGILQAASDAIAKAEGKQ